MGKPKSGLGKFFSQLVNLAVLVACGWGGWYAYSQIDSAPPSVSNVPEQTRFNCRQALAKLATDYGCMDDGTCEKSHDELDALRQLESDIAEFCN